MKVALINGTVVQTVIVADLEFARTLGYEKALEVTPQNRVPGGWLIEGVMYTDKVLPAEESNQRTLRDLGRQALTSNLQDLATIDQWLTTGPGAGTANLTAAQQSQFARQTAQNMKSIFKQLDVLIRLELGEYDSTQ